MNPLNWAQSMLILRAPRALADVQRLEADSKFFRSLVIVLPACGVIAAIWDTGVARWLEPAAAMVLTVLAMRRFADQRLKFSRWAYRYATVLSRLPPEPPPPGGQA
jgi:hypothetical protein